ncbi:hypothetical protein FF36_01554 [Frankia torreyi]|uniref:Uncharacterized protein n=1 Tax=Frankia torreyi TaxID=1856 RepID=A0A0D8BJ27_9ACTN|nr:hypothetical protein FF36_01554 [Frankia torreyi]KQM06068.1 hypothetical protein FF86_101193 [Frankia sp. CpI1-P]
MPVTHAAAVLPDSPIQSRNVPVAEVDRLVTTSEASSVSPRPARTVMSRSRRMMMLPASMSWCQTNRRASRSASIQARPASSNPSRPMMPTPTLALPIDVTSSLSANPGR